MKGTILYKLYLAMMVAMMLAVGISGLITAEKVKITYMSWYTGDSQVTESAVISAFMASNPDIEVEKIAGDPRSRLLVMIAGGAPPDVAILDSDGM